LNLVVDETPRAVDLPADLAEALDEADMRRFFDGLPNAFSATTSISLKVRRRPRRGSGGSRRP
jgi:hypothetical protein